MKFERNQVTNDLVSAGGGGHLGYCSLDKKTYLNLGEKNDKINACVKFERNQ